MTTLHPYNRSPIIQSSLGPGEWRLISIQCLEAGQQWYCTQLRQARSLAEMLSRILTSDCTVVLQLCGTELTRRQWQPVLPFILDRRTQTRWRRPQRYAGPISYGEVLDAYAGRGEQFTPNEKRRTYLKLQALVGPEHYLDLVPLPEYVFIRRTELPPRRAWKKAQAS